MGVPEEAGKAVGGIVEALKTTPVILAILIFNVLYVGLNAWQTMDARVRFHALLSEMMRICAGNKPTPSSVVFKPSQEKLLFSLDPTLRDQSSQPR